MAGWVRIDRDIFKHEIFETEPFSEREAWIWIITRAAWRDTTHRVGRKAVPVPRGSFFATHREIARAWRWKTHTRVKRFLSMLASHGMISTETVDGKTLITVCNYDQYQDATGQKKDDKQERKPAPFDEQAEAAQPAPTPPEDATPTDSTDTLEVRERLLLAMGLEPTGMTPAGRVHGNSSDMLEAGRWANDLGLTVDEQIGVICDVTARRAGQPPPNSFRFFTDAMRDFAGRKAAPRLTAMPQTETTGGNPDAPRRPKSSNPRDNFLRAFVTG